MFDKLIVTEPEGADFRNRRSYFMVSSLIVGLLFITAVVISIYAADYGLGNDSFELSLVVAPPEMTTAEPLSQPQRQRSTSLSRNESPSRQVNMSRVDEPTIVPTTISTVANNQLSRPLNARFNIGPRDTDTAEGTGRNLTSATTGPSGLNNTTEPIESEIPDLPPVKKPVEEKPKGPVTGGVVNGKATYLPKPPYPASAKLANIQGKVDVAVTIDENGKVISARAISGNALLKPSAENAAWQARFTPTLLTNVPVKVTGVIVYNFAK